MPGGPRVRAKETKLDRTRSVEAQALEAVRQLLSELGGSRGLEELAARGTSAHLERQLGLGSLERVELMLRLAQACGVRLPDRVVAEADTIQDLIDAILRGESEIEDSRASPVRAAPPERTAPSSRGERPRVDEQILRATTLTEILRLRALGGPEPRTITFGELYNRASAVARELLGRGLEPGQTVGIMLPTCAEFFDTFAGILLSGGIPVPIYPPFRADRIAEHAT